MAELWCKKNEHDWADPNEPNTYCLKCTLTPTQAGAVIQLEEEKKHYARQLGAANKALKYCRDDKEVMQNQIDVFEEQITQLESTISGYEAVMKSKELIDGTK